MKKGGKKTKMNNITKYGWWILIGVVILLTLFSYFNFPKTFEVSVEQKEELSQKLQDIEESPRLTEFMRNNPSPCAESLYDEKLHEVSNEIFDLVKGKKYAEVIALGDKHLEYTPLWYCNNYFWIQRAQAFYNLSDCKQALDSAVYAIFATPDINGVREPEIETYFSILNSNICEDL
ncbi:MAG: hypothetical protein WD963_02345 [Candidatus Paceibacterota bacterium]